MIGIAFCSWFSWVLGTVLGAFSGSGLLEDYPAVESALSFMLPALFMSFLLASFQRKQAPPSQQHCLARWLVSRCFRSRRPFWPGSSPVV